jgi:hypothetical protein
VRTDYELHIANRPPRLVLDQIRSRFGEVAVRRDADRTVLTGTVIDQPALRALLTLVWDSGGDVLAVLVDGEPHPGRNP